MRHVQELRKQAGLDIADRIHLFAVATSLLADAIAAHRSYIVGETLARSLDDHPLKAAPTVFTAALEFDGERAQVSLYKDLSMSYIDWLRSRVGHRKIVLTFTSVILRDGQDRILLQQRSDFDARGLLGGVLEFGESILDCARRELFEETGLTAGDLGLAGVYSEPEFDVVYPNGDQVQQYTICLQGRVKGGSLRADGQESRAVQFFSPGELPLPQIPPWYWAMLNDLLRSAGGAVGFDSPVSRAVLLPRNRHDAQPAGRRGVHWRGRCRGRPWTGMAGSRNPFSGDRRMVLCPCATCTWARTPPTPPSASPMKKPGWGWSRSASWASTRPPRFGRTPCTAPSNR